LFSYRDREERLEPELSLERLREEEEEEEALRLLLLRDEDGLTVVSLRVLPEEEPDERVDGAVLVLRLAPCERVEVAELLRLELREVLGGVVTLLFSRLRLLSDRARLLFPEDEGVVLRSTFELRLEGVEVDRVLLPRVELLLLSIVPDCDWRVVLRLVLSMDRVVLRGLLERLEPVASRLTLPLRLFEGVL
jgi:hypothetical protein